MNPGISPISTSTPVGQLRHTLGDTASVPLEPPVEGMVSYNVYSDAALEVFLALTSGNVLRAAAAAVKRLAIEYAAVGKSIKTDDLSINVASRGKDLLEVAAAFSKEADAADATAGANFFAVVPGRARRRYDVRPEATPYPYPQFPAGTSSDDLVPADEPGYWTLP